VVPKIWTRGHLNLENLIKVSLDELRMQMLGVQVLFGFQFQGLFQQGFHDVSAMGRQVDALGASIGSSITA